MKMYSMIFVLVAMIWQTNAVASQNQSVSFAGSKRLALFYAPVAISNINASNITRFSQAQGAGFSFEVGMPFSICLNGQYFENRDVRVNWKGSPNTPVEFYGYVLDLGIKVTLPTNVFQPWLEAGYGVGVLTFSNPNDRETSSAMIGVYSRGSRSSYGAFGAGGLDIMMGTSGLRVSYTLRAQTTDLSAQIGNQPYDMTLATWGFGVFANL